LAEFAALHELSCQWTEWIGLYAGMVRARLGNVIFPGGAVKFPDGLMDDVDRRLIALLRDDASRPLKSLAAEVNLSRSSVRDRIARMQADGVIRRFTIEVAPAAQATAILRIRLHKTPDPAVVNAVVSRTDVVRCYSLSGDIDLFVEIGGTSVADINRTRDEVAQLSGIADVETSFVLKQDKA
jgi:DNA-binding Lrp family transcriptional regulator